jgi:hypothetical protein
MKSRLIICDGYRNLADYYMKVAELIKSLPGLYYPAKEQQVILQESMAWASNCFIYVAVPVALMAFIPAQPLSDCGFDGAHPGRMRRRIWAFRHASCRYRRSATHQTNDQSGTTCSNCFRAMPALVQSVRYSRLPLRLLPHWVLDAGWARETMWKKMTA